MPGDQEVKLDSIQKLYDWTKEHTDVKTAHILTPGHLVWWWTKVPTGSDKNNNTLHVIDLRVLCGLEVIASGSWPAEIKGAKHFPIPQNLKEAGVYTDTVNLDTKLLGRRDNSTRWNAQYLAGLYPFKNVRRGDGVVFHCDFSSIRTPAVTKWYLDNFQDLGVKVFILEGGFDAFRRAKGVKDYSKSCLLSFLAMEPMLTCPSDLDGTKIKRYKS